jgi:hypothetical protein
MVFEPSFLGVTSYFLSHYSSLVTRYSDWCLASGRF